MKYKDLKYGDTFKIQPEGKMVQCHINGQRCKDRRVFMKTNDGSLEIINCQGNECYKDNCRIYCYLNMDVYSVNVYQVKERNIL